MKIETTVDISKPPSEVYEFLMDEENLTLWIKNFVKLERLNGEDGQVGSTSRHVYNENGRIVELMEEISAVEENKLFEAILSNKHMEMRIRNELQSQAEQNTRLRVISEVIPKSFLFRIMLFFSKKSMQRRQSEDIHRLKEAVEALGEYE